MQVKLTLPKTYHTAIATYGHGHLRVGPSASLRLFAAETFLQCIDSSEKVNSTSIHTDLQRLTSIAPGRARNILDEHDEFDEHNNPQTEVVYRPFRDALKKAPEGDKFCTGNCSRKKGPRLVRVLALF